MTSSFFEEGLEQSKVKARIVEEYFYVWAKIITAAQNRHGGSRVGYVDLFAGPGRYKTGALSTPLRVLLSAIEDEVFSSRLVTIFNDKDEAHVRSLQSAVDALPGIEKLKHQPKIWHEEVGDNIARQFEAINTIPLLAFIDPWGYKGLTLRLVDAFLKDWGCDCVFFFTYNRINARLSNPLVRTHMEALFGVDLAAKLTSQLEQLGPAEREATIVNALGVALKEYGHRFVLPFCFKSESGMRTSHHLILVTKHFKGYEVMKDIMAKHSSLEHQGVPTFSYLPPTATAQQLLFDLNRPLDELRGELLAFFAGRSLTMRKIYEIHSVDRPFLSRNYKTILSGMHQNDEVTTDRPPRKGTFADNILVSFPSR